MRRLSITAVGAEMEIDRSLSYGGEVLAALAGPLVNLALALTFCRFSRGWVFAGLNLALCCFNLLPVGRLDGGRVLRCVLAWLLGPEAAWRAGINIISSSPSCRRAASASAMWALWTGSKLPPSTPMRLFFEPFADFSKI